MNKNVCEYKHTQVYVCIQLPHKGIVVNLFFGCCIRLIVPGVVGKVYYVSVCSKTPGDKISPPGELREIA